METGGRETHQYFYDAFISYRHTEPDMKAAIKLHKALEGFRVPAAIAKQSGIKKIKRLFRDQEELPTSSNLSDDIQKALEQSHYLIVVCSPRTPQSNWCCQEIQEFRKLHGENRILTILIEGEPYEAFPESLRFTEERIQNPDGTEEIVKREVEPLAADIRGKSPEEMWKKLKVEKLRLLSPMLGVRFDDLRHRQRERFIKRAVAISATVSAFFAAFGIVATLQSNIIAAQSKELVQKNDELQTQIAQKEEQRALADKNGQEAQKQAVIALDNQKKAEENESRALAKTSKQETDDGNRLAGIQLALDALPKDAALSDRPFVPEAISSLYSSFYNKPFQGRFIVKDHGGLIYGGTYSPDSRYMVTVAGDLTMKIWDVASGKIKLNLDQQGFEEGASIGLGNKYVVTNDYYSEDGNIVWDLETGKTVTRLQTFTGMQVFNGYKFSTDCKRLVVTNSTHGVIVFDTETWSPISSFDMGDGTYTDYKYAIDFIGNKIIAYSPTAADFKVYSMESGSVLSTGKADGNVSFATVSPNGQRFAICSDTGKISLYDGSSMQNVGVLSGHTSKINGAAFNEKYGYLLTYSDDKTARLWDYMKGKPLYAFNEAYGAVTSADISPNDDFAVTGYEDGRAVVWNCTTGEETAILDKHENSVMKVFFSPDGKTLTTISYDNTARVWDVYGGNEYAILNGHTGSVQCVDFSPDGKKVATASKDGSLKVWDPASGKELFKIYKEGTWFLNTRFSADGKTLMAAEISKDSYYFVKTYDANDGTEIASTDYFFYPYMMTYNFEMMHEQTEMFLFWDFVSMVWDRMDLKAFDDIGPFFVDPTTGKFKLCFGSLSNDGKKFVSVTGIPTEIAVWYMDASQSMVVLKTLDEIINSAEYAFFNPDASKVVTVSYGKGVYVWDASTGDKIMKLPDQASMYTFATWSPDGKTLAAGCIDGTICLWDCENSRMITKLNGHSDAVNWLDFSSDGKSLASVGYDGTAIVWRIFPDAKEMVDYGNKLLKTY